MNSPVPTICRFVVYTLSADDAAQINRRRTTSASISERINNTTDAGIAAWPVGAQAHIGNEAKEGDAFPMLIVKTWGDTPEAYVNGQVFLDGNDVFWATSVSVGVGPRTWAWPTRT